MLEFPVDKIEWAIFKGEEQEGPNKGVDTLFVVGNAPFDLLYKYVGLYNSRAIYLGAGGRFDYSKKTALELSKIMNNSDILTIECPVFDFMLMKQLCFHHKNTYWVVPYIWHGRLIEIVGDPLRHFNSLQNYSNADKVLLKVDTGAYVCITSLADTFLNKYSDGYFEDVLVTQKER
jgi:hypothetical protein